MLNEQILMNFHLFFIDFDRYSSNIFFDDPHVFSLLYGHCFYTFHTFFHSCSFRFDLFTSTYEFLQFLFLNEINGKEVFSIFVFRK